MSAPKYVFQRQIINEGELAKLIMCIMCTTSLSKQRGSTLSHLHAKFDKKTKSEFNLIGMFYVLNKFSFLQSMTKK